VIADIESISRYDWHPPDCVQPSVAVTAMRKQAGVGDFHGYDWPSLSYVESCFLDAELREKNIEESKDGAFFLFKAGMARKDFRYMEV
jgi:hypothetical protein